MKSWKRILVLLAIICAILQGKLIYSLLYMVLLTYLLSLYYPRYLLKNLKLQRNSDSDRLFVGESANLRLSIVNQSRLPMPWLAIRQNLPYTLASSIISHLVSLGPGGSETITVELKATERGFFKLGQTMWTVGDPLGMSDLAGSVAFGDYIIVYPRIYPIEGCPLVTRTFLGDTRSSEPYFEDPARLTGIRDYLIGDSPRKIHWKVTARAGSLKVKELDPSVLAVFHLFLNLDEGDYKYGSVFGSDPETAIEFAASLAYRLDCQRAQVGLSSNGGDGLDQFLRENAAGAIPPENGVTLYPAKHSGIVNLLEILARARAAMGQSFADMVANRLSGLPKGSTIVIITPKASEDIQRLAKEIHTHGYRIYVFLIGHPKPDQLAEMFWDSVPAYYVYKAGKGESLSVKRLTDLKKASGTQSA